MKVRTLIRLGVLGVTIVTFGIGCANLQNQGAGSSPETSIVGNPPKECGFSKIRVGMTSGEVEAILGKPNDKAKQMTGKMFIPIGNLFISGSESTRFFYKGQGRIFLDNENALSNIIRVVRVEYDPAEPGYAR